MCQLYVNKKRVPGCIVWVRICLIAPVSQRTFAPPLLSGSFEVVHHLLIVKLVSLVSE